MSALLDHVVLEVRDAARSVQFYQDLLGFEPVRLEAFNSGEAPFPSVRINEGTLIDFFPKNMWGDSAHHTNPNHICFTFSEPEVRALKDRMASMEVPTLRTLERSYGAQGFGRSIYFPDPDGITLEVRHYDLSA